MSAIPARTPVCDAREQLRRLCEMLEVPLAPCCGFRRHHCDCEEYRRTEDCDHPPIYTPPCRHVLAREHDYGWVADEPDDEANCANQIREWAVLLRRAYGHEDYSSPPAPPIPSTYLRRQDRVAVMAERHGHGFGLFHPRDVWSKRPLIFLRVAAVTRHLRNGADDPEERLVADADALAPSPAPWPYQQEPPKEGETDRERQRRERSNRVNLMLTQLQRDGCVDYAEVYGDDTP